MPVDDIITNLLVGKDELHSIVNRSINSMQMLEAQARKTQQELKRTFSSQADLPQGDFGKIFSPTLAKKNAFLSKAEQDYQDIFGKGRQLAFEKISKQKVDMPQMPDMSQLLGGVSGEIGDLNKIKSLGAQLGQLKAEGVDVTSQINHMQEILGKGTEKMGLFNNAMNQSIERSKEMKNRFDMNTLSWMFGGMALQRVSMTMMRFFIPSMKRLGELNTEGAKKVQAMTASFEFLKISMFETLSNTDLFKNVIEFLIRASEALAEFTQKHPEMVSLLATVAAIGVVLGTIAIGVGIFKQLAHLGTLLGVSGKGGIYGGVKKLVKYLKGLNWDKILPIAGKTLTIGTGVVLAGFSISEMLKAEDIGGKVGFAIAGLLSAAGAITAWFNPAIGLTLVIAGAVLFALTSYRFEIAGEVNKDKIMEEYLKGMGLDTEQFVEMRAAWNLHGATGTQARIFDTEAAAIQVADLALQNHIAATEELETLQEEIENGKVKDIKRSLEKVSVLEDEIAEHMRIGMIADKNFLKRLEQENAIMDFQDKKIQKILEEENAINDVINNQEKKKEKISEVSEQEIEAYANTFAEQLKSDKKTKDMMANLEEFGKTAQSVLGNSEEQIGVIGKFNLLGMEITLDHEYFTNLKNDIEDWASKVTTKTIRIKYDYDERRDDDEGFFERVGRNVDETVSSITS